MARSWAEVSADPNFTALNPAEQEGARQAYFQHVVAPNLPKDADPAAIKAQFDAHTQNPVTAAALNANPKVEQPPVPEKPAAGPWWQDPKPLNALARIPGNALSDVAGIAENVGSIASGAIAQPVSGLVGLARAPFVGADQAANDVRGVQNALTYSPRTEAGQEDQRIIGDAAEKVGNAQQAGIEKLGGGPGAVTAIPALEQAVPAVLGLRGVGGAARALKPDLATGEIPAGAAARAETAAGVQGGTVNPVVELQQHGFQFRPSDVQARNPSMAKVPGSGRESVTPSQQAGITRNNQVLATRLYGEDIGVPEANKLTEAHFEGAKERPAAGYDRVADAVQKIDKPQESTITALRAAAADNSAQALPAKVRADLTRMANGMESGTYPASKVIKDISFLRTKGDAGFDVASALEDELGAQVKAKAPELGNLYEDSRTQFAKIYEGQAATKGGQIDMGAYARRAQKNPRLLTGNSRIVASAGNELPEVTRAPTAEVPGEPVKSTLFGTLAAGAKGALSKAASVTKPDLQAKIAAAAPKPGPLPVGPQQSGYVRPRQIDALGPGGEGATLERPPGPPLGRSFQGGPQLQGRDVPELDQMDLLGGTAAGGKNFRLKDGTTPPQGAPPAPFDPTNGVKLGDQVRQQALLRDEKAQQPGGGTTLQGPLDQPRGLQQPVPFAGVQPREGMLPERLREFLRAIYRGR